MPPMGPVRPRPICAFPKEAPGGGFAILLLLTGQKEGLLLGETLFLSVCGLDIGKSTPEGS